MLQKTLLILRLLIEIMLKSEEKRSIRYREQLMKKQGMCRHDREDQSSWSPSKVEK